MKKVKIGPHILVRGDCLNVMPKMPAQKIDMILCDLPYGTTSCKWDAVLPFDVLWREYQRLCSGAVVLTASQPFTSALVMSNVKNFRHEWIWEKNQGTNPMHAKRQPMKNHESILVFGPKSILYSPQKWQSEPYKPWTSSKDKGIGAVYGDVAKSKHYGSLDGSRYPLSIQKFDMVRRGVHPTQKPVSLCSYLIKTYTRPGVRILDNTMGSGTTGVSCIETGRVFVGIENDKAIFETACDRINDAYKKSLKKGLFKK